MNLLKLADWILKQSFYLLFFLVPLIMTPWNLELFEYNKMVLTYALTVVIIGAWISKMVISKKFIFKRSPFEIPIFIFLLSQFLSFLFSIDTHTSFWGYYTRFHGGLLSTITYVLLYFAFVSNLNKNNVLNVLKISLVSALLVSAYGIMEHFGIDAQYWVQDVRNRVFSTMGQPNWLAAQLAVLIPISIALVITNFTFSNKKLKFNVPNGLVKFIFYFITFLVLLICLIFTKSRSGIPAAVIGIVVFSFLTVLPRIITLKKIYSITIISLSTTILIVGLFLGFQKLFGNAEKDIAYIFGFTNQVNLRMQGPHDANPGSSSKDIRKVVWRGAVDVFKHYPIFGSGVETFAYSYYNFRPAQHNLLSEWDFLYNKAHNEYFNFLATTGAVGTGAYLLFIGWVIWWNIKNLKSQISNLILIFALFSGWFSILITNFFGFSVVLVALYFFLFPLIAYILTQEETAQTQPLFAKKEVKIKPEEVNTSSPQWIALSAVLLAVFYLLFSISRYWWADVLYAKGVKLDKQGFFEQAASTLLEATQFNKGEPVYKDELAWSYANLVVDSASRNQIDIASRYAQAAITSSDQALATSPKNLNFLKTRAKVFFRLSQVDGRFFDQATDVLYKTRELAPTDPKMAYNLGLVYLSLNQKEKALPFFEEAAKLKPNYMEAGLALAGLYNDLGQKDKAITEYEYLLQIGYEQPTLPLADIYYEKGNKQKAINLLKPLIVFPDINLKLKEWGYIPPQ